MKIGIDRISLYSSHYYIDLKTLAEQRQVDPEKFYFGIGQEKIAVPAPDEDVVTLGANAAYPLMIDEELDDVDLLKGEYKTGEATRDDMIKHFVKTSYSVGLTDRHVEKALALLDEQ